MAETARKLDLIDTTPAFVQADADRLNARFADAGAADMLRAMLATELKGRTAIVSSFGAESAVLLHIVATIDREIPLIFVNTQKMFGETLAYRDALAEQLVTHLPAGP